MSNKKTKERNKELRKKAPEKHPHCSEGMWEDMENREFWDVDALEKHNAPIRKKIKYWEEYQPVNWLGKWWVQTQLDKLHKKLQTYKRKDDE